MQILTQYRYLLTSICRILATCQVAHVTPTSCDQLIEAVHECRPFARLPQSRTVLPDHPGPLVQVVGHLGPHHVHVVDGQVQTVGRQTADLFVTHHFSRLSARFLKSILMKKCGKI
jgi:hypothetical protein